MEILNYISEKFWSNKFWLPPGYTWDDLRTYARYDLKYSLFYPVYTAICLFVVRILFERYIARPIGKRFGIKENDATKFVLNTQLEAYFNQNKSQTMSESIYMHLARETKMSADDVKKWFEARKLRNRPSRMNKFTEASWRFVFYVFIWLYGLFVLYSKPWLYSNRQFWANYPKHTMTDDLYWYYTVEVGFYLSLLVSQFFDVKRKDFWQMFLHHLVTILLLVLSYMCNFTRVGSFILLLHDCVDYWLELGKMAIYLSLPKLCNVSFAIFVIVWFVTRLVIFPIRVLYSTTIDGPVDVGGVFPAYYIFNIMLYILQVMHVMWFVIICRMAYRGLVKGSVEKDDRSESDADVDDEANDINSKNK